MVRDAWKASPHVRPRHFAPSAYDRSIRKHGGEGFSPEFARFAATTAEWNVSHQFPRPDNKRFPDVKRDGKVKIGGSKLSGIDHTSYRLYGLKGGRNAAGITITLSVSKKVRSALAVTGRKGSRKGGKIAHRAVAYLPHGGTVTLHLRRPGSYSRVTIAAINAEGRRRHGHYRGDHTPMRISVQKSALGGASCRC